MAPTVSLEDKTAFFNDLDALDERAVSSPESSFKARDFHKRQKSGSNNRSDSNSKSACSGQCSKQPSQNGAGVHRRSTSQPNKMEGPVSQGVRHPRTTKTVSSKAEPDAVNNHISRSSANSPIPPFDLIEILDESTESESENVIEFISKSSSVPRAKSIEPAGVSATPVQGRSPASKNNQRVQSLKAIAAAERGRKQTVSAPITAPNTVGLFSGVIFYFLPNNDVNKVRRLRIQAAISQGAQWVRSLDSCLTHVIAEEDITAETVMKFTKDKINLERIVIVKDKWLQESMTWKELRDPRQGRFQLKGASIVFPRRKRIEKTTSQGVRAEGNRGNISHIDRESRLAANLGDSMAVAPRSQEQGQISAEDELATAVHEVRRTSILSFDEDIDVHKVTFAVPAEGQLSTCSKVQLANTETNDFRCMAANIAGDSRDNPNARTIAILQQMASIYDRTGDDWRSLAYRKAIGALQKQKTSILTATQAQTVPAIGARLARKIEEIATTDRLLRLEHAQSDPGTQTLELFMNIYGVGLKEAHAFIARGWRTLDDLHMNINQLSGNQQVGLEHYYDFLQSIPRAEVEQHAATVGEALRKVDNNIRVIIAGSYRRGSLSSGDIDLIITHAEQETTISRLCSIVVDTAVPVLFASGFLKAALAIHGSRGPGAESALVSPGRTAADDPGTKWHGASCLPSSTIWRRIDLLLVPPAELGAALIYFTGNDVFNRSIRLLASKKGMRLNRRGLYKDVVRSKGRKKSTDGELVEAGSEKKIFALLGVPWREPHERQC